MSTITLTFLESDATRLFNRKTFKCDVNCTPYMAPLVYVDSGSPLGALAAFPLSTAVSLGNKYLYGNDALHKYRYWECTQAGTTGASHITSSPSTLVDTIVGQEITSGTAKFRLRGYHGWSRALNAFSADIMPRSTIFVPINTTAVLEWRVLVASGHAQTVSAGFQMRMNPVFNGSGSGYSNVPGYSIISVDNTPAIPVTFSAGASILGTGNASAMFPSSDVNALGLVRGVTLGHDNTANTPASNFDRFSWSQDVRFYDCTFQSYRQNFAASTTDYAHTGARHSVRCAYKSLDATSPAPALATGGSIVEAPTFQRLTSATTPVVRGIATATDLSTNPGQADAVLLGADLSSFTKAYDTDQFSGATVRFGNAFRAFGVPMASGGLTLPSVPPMDVGFSMLNTTVVDELHPPSWLLGTHYGREWEMESPSTNKPTLSRELTIIRTGGASDALGNFSYKTEVRNRLHYPYQFEFYNSKTDESFLITLEFQWSSTGSGLTALTEEDVWLEASYLNDASRNSADYVFSFDKYTRRGLIYNDAVGPAALASSVAAWGGALSGAVKQKVSIVVTPRKAGPVKVRVGLWLCPFTQNLASVTTLPIYICPLPTLSAAP